MPCPRASAGPFAHSDAIPQNEMSAQPPSRASLAHHVADLSAYLRSVVKGFVGVSKPAARRLGSEGNAE